MAAPGAKKGRSHLNTDRWRRIESLCHAALARPAEDRAAYLAEACGGDQALREEVESLVAEGDADGSFLELPVVGGAVSPPLVGRQLGPYRIEAPIGAGGMGEVYHAKDTRLNRNVAIKVLPPQWTADRQRRTRFEREARAVAALKHPNICTIYDIGHDDGTDFLVMELVEGESLAARLSRGPLPCDEAVARAIEIASALDEAHRQGIIHRDLKPGNVMLTRSGSGTSRGAQAKLLDFGLARIISPDMTAQLSWGPDTPMTEAGGLFGTVEYMAPEQIQGAPTDARTDLFAFGALLYEMLTGRMAFGRATKAESLTAVLRDHPDQTVLERSGAASSVIRIVRRCLEKDPADRFQTARDLAFALENAASPREPETPSAEDGTITRVPYPAAPSDLRRVSDDGVGGRGSVDGGGACRGAANPKQHAVYLVASRRNDPGFGAGRVARRPALGVRGRGPVRQPTARSRSCDTGGNPAARHYRRQTTILVA